MISRQELIPTSTMSRNLSGAPKLADTCSTSQSPKSCVPKAQNKVRIVSQNLVGEPIELWGELGTDVLGGEEGRVGFDAGGLGAAEVFKAVAGRVT